MATCWACGGTRAVPRKARNLEGPVRAEDLRITDARYGTTLALAQCQECGFLFAEDADLEQLTALYAALDDPAYEEGDEPRALQMRWLLGVCRKAAPGARTLLDVGAATGLLVEEATRAGFEATGVEPSAQLAEAARRRGANVLGGTLPHPELVSRRFDVVTIVDVIEHVRDPVGLLRSAADRLAPGGLLVVVTPDVRSIAARVLGDRWWHFRVAHVGYFTRSSFERAATRAGLSVVGERRARWFFPVRYLLERLTRYLPVAGAPERIERLPLGSRLLQSVIPLNLFDSSLFLVRSAARE